MDIDALRKKALELPKKPGVYIMKDVTGEVIYVGKAKALKNRVTQYFQKGTAHTPKTAHMVAHVSDFDIIITETEFEALVLECSLIKRHRPRYNILLKDDKGYPYIRMSVKEDYPRMVIAQKPAKDGARYFGPYGGRRSARLAIDAVCEILKLPTCTRKFPQEIGKQRPCLNHHLKKCIGVCAGTITKDEYHTLMNEAIALLEGKLDLLVNDLNKKMEESSANLEFEKAAVFRDKLKAISNLDTKQKVMSGAFSDLDIIVYKQGRLSGCVVVLHYINGSLLGKELEFFPGASEQDAQEVLSGFMKQYYALRQVSPPEILISSEIEDQEALSEWMSQLAGRKVTIAVPQKGKKRALILLGLQNAEEELLRFDQEKERASKSLKLLAELLKLPKVDRIEAYDISNTAGEDTVGSMVVFEGGKPLKKDYRRFKIKTIRGQDDYGSMQEVLRRRFFEYKAGDERFCKLPSLLLIDGGRGHVGAVKAVLEELSIELPLFGMVKDDHHRTRALIASDGHEIGIRATPVLFSLIGRIQEEAHRFAIEYHRSLRAKRGYQSELDQIPGVGQTRREKLFKRFETMQNIKSATVSELNEILPINVSETVYAYFHQNTDRI
ncbi:MAG: excinuclease ABC subunit UvrC [Clostridiales bacterium]|nr:excinuclease ABC subunit UvrC [Clostridiales bacterium]